MATFQRPVEAVGIAWYDEADYPAILALMVDGHLLPRTFEEWHQKARRAEQETRARGARAVRVKIDPEHFAGWCALRGLDIDAKARMRFANEEAARQMGIL